MKRRDFITLLGGGAAAWPLAARAQQGERMRLVGTLTSLAESDPEGQARDAAFRQGLQQLDWIEGRNLQIEARWSTGGDPARSRQHIAQLLALAPDVIVAGGSALLAPLLQATRTVPIVFAIVPDPVGAGFVDSLARPGGNATGFVQLEDGLSGKWLELLKEVSPGVTRAAVLREPGLTAAVAQFAALQAVAPALRGLIVTSGPLAAVHRDVIVTAAARHRLPAVYFSRYVVASGGMISYGPDFVDQYSRAAAYVDRILKGEEPADLPVQAPTKYELVINLKTAKTLGLEVPPMLLARADEVIE